MKIDNLTIICIAGNEEKNIVDCFKSANFAKDMVMVAANSHDMTKSLAKKNFPNLKIIEIDDEYGKHFAKWRNLGLTNSSTDWIFYIDADERITPSLKNEILSIISQPVTHTCYAVPRANYFLGQRVRHGGTYPDYVRRLFYRPSLKKWTGILHEQPEFSGTQGYLKQDLLHFTHTDLTSMLIKSISWTQAEAQALYDSGHPPVVWWRFIRMIITKLWERLFTQKMFLDGTVGWISAIFEAFDTFIIYSRLWELQQRKTK